MKKTFMANKRLRLVVYLAVAIVVIVAPLMLSPYMNFQLSMVAVFAVAILGLNIIMGYTGQISLGQSAFVGLGAYMTAYGVLSGWPIVVTFLLACLVPAAVGFLVALPAVRLRGHALAVVTLGLPIIALPLARRFPDFTGGSNGKTVDWMNAPAWSGLAVDQWRYYVIIIIAAIFFLFARNLVTGRIGRAFTIVRENEAVATSMGISSYRYKVLAFTISSLYGGAAGFLYLGAVQFTSPETSSFLVAINILAAMVIGGSGSIAGSLIGGAFYVTVPFLAGQVNSSQTAIFSGAALLIVLLIVPGGLVTVPRAIRQLLAKRTARANARLNKESGEVEGNSSASTSTP
ncbi:MAG: branched-chain amino acid ABC transporter permease [Lacisediminihabitans sp.]